MSRCARRIRLNEEFEELVALLATGTVAALPFQPKRIMLASNHASSIELGRSTKGVSREVRMGDRNCTLEMKARLRSTFTTLAMSRMGDMEAVADVRGVLGWLGMPLSEALGVSEGEAPSESVAVAEVVTEGVSEVDTELVGESEGAPLGLGVVVTLGVCDSEGVWLGEPVCVGVWLGVCVEVPV